MRVVLLADGRFASRERSMLARLQVGLADEGVRVVLALPRGFGDNREDLVHQTVHFEESGLPLSLSWRAEEAAERVRRLEESGGESTGLVHVFGGALWPFGQALAERLGGALVLEVWRSGLIRQAARLVGRGRGVASTLALCADSALAERVAREAAGVRALVAPWGVYSSEEPRRVLEPGAAWSVMIAGGGLDREAFTACFRAVAAVVLDRPDMLVFVDALAARRTGLWQEAERLGVRSRVSLVDEMDANRDLVLRGDVLVLPEARGEQRTLVLEAMVRGMPVVAARDPDNSMLMHERTALLVEPGDLVGWERELARLLGDAGLVGRLAASAREHVATEHRSSRQVGAVLEAYESVLGKAPIPFPGSDSP